MTEVPLTESKYDYKNCFNRGFELLNDVFTTGAEEAPFTSQMSEFAMAYQGINGHEFFPIRKSSSRVP